MRALAGSEAAALAADAHALLGRDADLRSQILSVGLPIVTPDGERVYRGSVVALPVDACDPLAAAPRGWVDLRPAQFGVWAKRAAAMVRQAEAGAARPNESGSAVSWTAIKADHPIEPSWFATWVFTHEDRGERIKR